MLLSTLPAAVANLGVMGGVVWSIFRVYTAEDRLKQEMKESEQRIEKDIKEHIDAKLAAQAHDQTRLLYETAMKTVIAGGKVADQPTRKVSIAKVVLGLVGLIILTNCCLVVK